MQQDTFHFPLKFNSTICLIRPLSFAPRDDGKLLRTDDMLSTVYTAGLVERLGWVEFTFRLVFAR